MPEPPTKPAALPEKVQNAADYLPLARQRLRPEIWRYLQDGCGNQVSLEGNSQAFDRIPLMPRPLADVKGGHTRIHLLGQELAHPIVLAPVAYQRLFHQHGESASAMAASAQEGQMCVSSLASQTLEEIISAAERPLWFQLYWQGNRERTLKLLRRAIAAGYHAILFTVDAPVKQAVIQLPTTVSAVNLEDSAPFPALSSQQSEVFDDWMAQAPGWDDLAWLRDQIHQPFVVKGILHPEDAEKVIELGCDGLVVSNHGGRVLDGVPSSIECLAEIVRVVDGRGKVLFDSGIRSGRDVYKALALGADAVMLGRPYVWGLAAAGAMGVAHVVRLLRDELELTMALTGTAGIQEIAMGKVYPEK